MNNKVLVILALIGLYLGAWFSVINNRIKLPKQYNSYISEARRNAELGIYITAIENYSKALAIKDDDIDIHLEMAKQYLVANDPNSFINYCNELMNKFPKSDKPYVELAKYYKEQGDYIKCFRSINSCKARGIQSGTLAKIEKNLEYVYEFAINSYADVKSFNEGVCPVYNGKKWGFVNTKGKVVISFKYDDAAEFSSSVAAVKENDEAYYINNDGDKILATKDKFDEFSLFSSEDLALAVKNGKYCFVNKKLEVVFGEYDFAGNFGNSVAAVKNGEMWALIDTSGKQLTEYKYKDIKLDEKGRCYRNGVAFVKEQEKYYMINKEGKKLSDKEFDDVRLYVKDEPTAVKVGDKWGFIDNNGNLTIEPQFEDARPFSNGFAAVKVDEKWGYIDSSGKMAIAPTFLEAKEFNENGSAFVKVGDVWRLIMFYKNKAA